ncbi:hypothetical protein T492DRAFT_1013517 [Pavlovales sp. CCMP2436]|nr:hypothetical protein T492DRAFT_1013517 [Pavlovales sp. CCMP2436]
MRHYAVVLLYVTMFTLKRGGDHSRPLRAVTIISKTIFKLFQNKQKKKLHNTLNKIKNARISIARVEKLVCLFDPSTHPQTPKALREVAFMISASKRQHQKRQNNKRQKRGKKRQKGKQNKKRWGLGGV